MLSTELPSPPTLIGPLTDFSRLPLPALRQRVACGFPSPAEDFFVEEDRLDLNTKLVANPAATFLAWADTGGSMVDFGIQDGDLLVIDRSVRARHGHTVLVLWEGGFMVKKLDIQGGRIRLLASRGVPAIEVGEGVELDVWGVVRWSLTKHV
ncbi:translesion error-prone DNA polymerase V autoproteolytic subunit [Luteimonas sp. MC1750]|uniref:LexA family protein n=1 Tax=Luteimonas sp. MC1750 TaxID=2799326 RepID=UPI0018F0865E|nr:translesion error-prone DNA polymerase V autoproteolytic subunit [Luteimonas sp. MC1750]MBJ6983968.1 translesion error-prone DNA polymerase V autoproteolytic subunit [Luteimonas sp. MC1750]QQO06781.1 translesion error-prone DNA polymerase V autoproteolytic subunit [Luteimonas sp. MC1750]